VVVLVTQVTLTRGANNLITQTTTNGTLVPCNASYFNGFQDTNTDYGFITGLPNAFCLPSNMTFSLTAISARTTMQYMTVQVINKTSDTATTNFLKTLTSTYVVGILMTVPVIDTAKKQFNFSVQQVRGYLSLATRTMSYNISLTKQQITFTTPNYTLSPSSPTTLSTYNYLNNKGNEFTYTGAATTLTRTYNISICYLGLVESYTVQQ
jgi:hypothetical protein